MLNNPAIQEMLPAVIGKFEKKYASTIVLENGMEFDISAPHDFVTDGKVVIQFRDKTLVPNYTHGRSITRNFKFKYNRHGKSINEATINFKDDIETMQKNWNRFIAAIEKLMEERKAYDIRENAHKKQNERNTEIINAQLKEICGNELTYGSTLYSGCNIKKAAGTNVELKFNLDMTNKEDQELARSIMAHLKARRIQKAA